MSKMSLVSKKVLMICWAQIKEHLYHWSVKTEEGTYTDGSKERREVLWKLYNSSVQGALKMNDAIDFMRGDPPWFTRFHRIPIGYLEGHWHHVIVFSSRARYLELVLKKNKKTAFIEAPERLDSQGV